METNLKTKIEARIAELTAYQTARKNEPAPDPTNRDRMQRELTNTSDAVTQATIDALNWVLGLPGGSMKKITPEHMETLIESETYSNTGKTTVCILKLQNGFEVVGTSGIVDVSQFDEGLGNKYAREVAINKLWELEGYRLQWALATMP